MRLLNRKVFKLCVALPVFGYVCFYVGMSLMPVHYIFKSEIYNQPCNIPSPDPFDPSIKLFFWKPDPLVCDSAPSLVFVDEFRTLVVNKSAMEYYHISKQSDFSCVYREVVRDTDDRKVNFTEWEKISNLPTNLSSDFNHVVCKTNGGNVVFDNIVHCIGTKIVHHAKQVGDESDSHPSILLFGMDAASRSASIRYLPKTRQYLDELGAYDFRGFMKVGDNTAPNLIPLLTGKRANQTELPAFISDFADGSPFIWKNFSSQDYVTMFSEDMPHVAAFNYAFRGFKQPPTDHYGRPFYLALAAHDIMDYKLSNIYRFLEDKGVKVGKKSIMCNQNTPNHRVHINYLKQFFKAYKGKRKFVFSFLTELAHTFINFLGRGDEDFVDFLKWLKTEGFLENTIVIFFSDHGSRADDLRNTYIGRIESRMPVLSIIFPEKIKQKHPHLHGVLSKNANRLVTNFDIYQTLLDVSEGNFDNPSKQRVEGRDRGISLFQPISENRSCYDAWIPEIFCACFKSSSIDVKTNSDIHIVASKAVEHINALLAHTKQCHKLSLSRIVSAREFSLGLKHTATDHNGYSLFRFLKPEPNRRKYSIALETVPGNALFDVTCESKSGSDVKIIGIPERTNKYGNQSICVAEKLLKQYCYCGE